VQAPRLFATSAEAAGSLTAEDKLAIMELCYRFDSLINQVSQP
jgi:hypothetical protein